MTDTMSQTSVRPFHIDVPNEVRAAFRPLR
jgi:hypothetical protein